MLREAVLCLVSLSPTLLLAAGPPTAPYQPDEHTLFLHHFDGNALPDFARGSSTPTADPGERSFIAGRFGQAMLFSRTRRALRFPAAGNYDHRQGTIEFFVRLPDLDAAGFTGSRGFWQTQGGVQEKVRFVIGRGSFNSARTGVGYKDAWADLRDGQLGLKSDISHWKADQWHHVAVLWDGSSARLLLDGVCVARGEFPGFPEAAPAFDVGTNAIVALDELRISDIMREELQVADEVKELTPYRPIGSQPAAAAQKRPPIAAPHPRPSVIRLHRGVPNLFVDDWLVELKGNVTRRLGDVRKYEGNPVISPEGIWEETAAFPFSGGVFRPEPGRWMMFYNTYIRWRRGTDGTSVCIAYSKDGEHWRKPKLSQFEVRGAKTNNVVLRTPLDNATQIYDPADPDPNRRWKMITYEHGDQGAGLYGYLSPDGLHWTRLPKILIPNAGDRTALWHDTLRGKYVVFTRYAPKYRGRYIFQAESDDFEHWSEPQLVLDWTTGDRAYGVQHYGAGGFVYGDMYLGFLEMFHTPYRRLDTQLIASHDGTAWQRVCEGEVFLGNGPEGAFDHFWAFPAGSPPVRVGDELWFYYAGRGHPHTSPPPPVWPGEDDSKAARNSYWACTGLAKMRLDGFVSLDSSGAEGDVLTVPVDLGGAKRLVVNANADRFPPGSSWLRVGFTDQSMEPIAGYTLEDCDEFRGDEVEHVVTWHGKSDLGGLPEGPLRVQFRSMNTRLYSFTLR
ncbi:MAG: hypothetical protein J7M38_13515 [Armatimonadetes bacterium]|nr:hypothetical protein [Armatimonadota bacterium]